MPELHKLTPILGVLLDRGFKVALVTDGRMSGASGKVPAAIHVSPESVQGGPLARVRDGDVVRVDTTTGELVALVDESEWNARTVVHPDLTRKTENMGRELFAAFRQHVSTRRDRCGQRVRRPGDRAGGAHGRPGRRPGHGRRARLGGDHGVSGADNPTVRELMTLAPVIPVLVVDDVDAARPLAEALVAGGLPVLEVTLRTPVALEAMAAMADVPGAVVGVGTALDGDDLRRARDAGARFAVSPGYTDALGRVAREISLPPPARHRDVGRTSCARARRRLRGTQVLPRRAGGGGVAMLKGARRPVRRHRVLPHGRHHGRHRPRLPRALPNVLCVGGSWIAPKAMVAARDSDGITALAREAAALPR